MGDLPGPPPPPPAAVPSATTSAAVGPSGTPALPLPLTATVQALSGSVEALTGAVAAVLDEVRSIKDEMQHGKPWSCLECCQLRIGVRPLLLLPLRLGTRLWTMTSCCPVPRRRSVLGPCLHCPLHRYNSPMLPLVNGLGRGRMAGRLRRHSYVLSLAARTAAVGPLYM